MRRDFKYSYRARQEILTNLPVLFTRIIGHLQNLKSSAEFLRGPKSFHLSLVVFFFLFCTWVSKVDIHTSTLQPEMLLMNDFFFTFVSQVPSSSSLLSDKLK